jgi:hypothetical protein
LPALSNFEAKRRVPGEVVITVTNLRNAVSTMNDDVGREGVAGA